MHFVRIYRASLYCEGGLKGYPCMFCLGTPAALMDPVKDAMPLRAAGLALDQLPLEPPPGFTFGACTS